MVLAVDDYNKICGRTNEDYYLESPNFMIVFLLNMVTIGIYGFYWFYKYGNNLQELGRRKNIAIKDAGKSYLKLTLIPTVIVWVFALLSIIMIFVMYSGANSWNYRTVESSAVGFIICLILLMIAAVCSWVMTYVAWAKWLTNLNRITGMEYSGFGGGYGVIPQAPAAGSILILTGQYKDAVLPVGENEEIILGRDEARSHLVFMNEYVSRVHCGIRFERATSMYTVTDYSMNGTFIKGGARLEKGQSVLCNPGTVLVLGRSGEECRLL